MYAREINGQEFTFGVSGKLIRNVLVMYDRQTDSYWSQLLGEAVAGEMIGTKLEFLPSWMMPWEEWKNRHPDTVALSKNGRRGARDVYDSYYQSSSAGVIGETIEDDRLFTKQFIIGVELGDTAIAYPYSVLSDEPVLNDDIAGANLLIVFDPNAASAAIYDRNVGDQPLTFTRTEEPLILKDEETGSTWDGRTGEAISGPLEGEALIPVKSTTSFWFGWKDFHPDTLVYGIDE